MKFVYHKDGTTPSKGEIFVFGSNLSGIHGAGAAREAYENFRAIWGVGDGIMGQSYVLPTKGKDITFIPLSEVETHIKNFLVFAKRNENMCFWMTRVGCGLAGFRDEQIATLLSVS